MATSLVNEVPNVDNAQMNGVHTVPLSEDGDQSNANVLARPDTLRKPVADYRMTYAWFTGATSVATALFIHPMSSS